MNQRRAEDPIDPVLAAVEINSARSYRILAERFEVDLNAPPQSGLQREPVVMDLAIRLYQRAYCVAIGRPIVAFEPRPEPDGAAFLAELQAANASRTRWEDFWLIEESFPNGQVRVARDRERRLIEPGGYAVADGRAAVQHGRAPVRLCYPRESLTAQSGFYFAFGETPEDPGHAFGMVRLYLNAPCEAAVAVMAEVTSQLNRFRIPFRMKCPIRRDQFNRRDSFVMYVSKAYVPILMSLLPRIHARLSKALRDGVPLFTKPLAPGLSVAEDPENGESFGQMRCRILAEALWNCFTAGTQDADSRRAAFRDLLDHYGVEPEQPWLNDGSRDIYEADFHAGQ